MLPQQDGTITRHRLFDTSKEPETGGLFPVSPQPRPPVASPATIFGFKSEMVSIKPSIVAIQSGIFPESVSIFEIHPRIFIRKLAIFDIHLQISTGEPSIFTIYPEISTGEPPIFTINPEIVSVRTISLSFTDGS